MAANSNFVSYDKVQILAPCPRDIAEMDLKKEGCYFCHTCSKNVFDFTDKTEEEFNQILIENNYDVCGIFDTKKVDRTLNYLFFRRKWSSILIATTFLLFSAFSKTVQAQTDNVNIKMTNEVKVLKIDAGLANEKGVSEEVILPKKKAKDKVKKEEKPKAKKRKRRRRWNPFKGRQTWGCPHF